MVTHLLRIPLATHTSRSQISKSLAGVMADPTSANIPFDAWRNPDQLSINLGSLRLRSTEDLDEAKTLLVKLQAQGLRARGQSASALKRLNDLKGSGATPSHGSEEPSLQLKVSLRGLGIPSRQSKMLEATGLDGRIDGNAKTLFLLRRRVNLLFAKYQSKQAMTRPQPNSLTFGVMSTYILQSKAHASRGNYPTVERFDVRGLCDRYQDIVWAENVCLEKICLSEIALRDVYDRKGQLVGRAVYRDLASVALPGAPAPPLSITKTQLNYAPAKLAAPSRQQKPMQSQTRPK